MSLESLVRALRNARAEYQVEPGKKIAATLLVGDAALGATLSGEAAALSLLGRLDVEVRSHDGDRRDVAPRQTRRGWVRTTKETVTVTVSVHSLLGRGSTSRFGRNEDPTAVCGSTSSSNLRSARR